VIYEAIPFGLRGFQEEGRPGDFYGLILSYSITWRPRACAVGVDKRVSFPSFNDNAL